MNHSHLDGVEIRQAFAKPGGTGPECAELQRLELVGRLGTQLIITDERFDGSQELFILRHQDLRVEYARLLGSGALQYPLAELLEMGNNVVYRFTQPAHLVVHLVRSNGSIGHLGKVPAHDKRWPPGNAGGDADSSKLAGDAHSSPNPSATNAASASAACCASGPSARIM